MKEEEEGKEDSFEEYAKAELETPEKGVSVTSSIAMMKEEGRKAREKTAQMEL